MEEEHSCGWNEVILCSGFSRNLEETDKYGFLNVGLSRKSEFLKLCAICVGLWCRYSSTVDFWVIY